MRSSYPKATNPGCQKKHLGFGILDLMIAMVITIVVLLGVYKYWITNITSTTQTIKISSLQTNAEVIFNNIRDDLRSAGFNPLGLVGSDGNPKFRIFNDPERDDVSKLHRLRYSHYTEDPACTGPAATPGVCSATCDPTTVPASPVLDPTNPQNRDCCCSEFSIPSENGASTRKIVRKTKLMDEGVDTTLLLTNSCLAFIFWDAANDTPCQSQRTLSPCTGTTNSKTIKLVVAIASKENDAERFDMSGCLTASSNYSPCCEILPINPSDPNEKIPPYVRMEKMIHLRNLQ